MPMSFPDMKSLEQRAELRGFRPPYEGESESEYREAFADFMFTVDRVESVEIRTGKGWDRLDPLTMLSHALGGEDKLKSLMADLTGDDSESEQKAEEEFGLPVPEYPHLMITSPRDGDLCLMYVGEEAEQMIELLAVFMATSPVTRHSETTATQVTETEMMSAAASRVVVSKMMLSLIEFSENPLLQRVANELGALMLVQDLPLNITVNKPNVPDYADDDSFALDA